MVKILVTCPPMIKQIHNYESEFKKLNLEYFCPTFTQTMSEQELIEILPEYDGWIIGDDPATRRVFEAGKSGKLRAAVKWGVGVDNVDFTACKDLNIPITNTPGVFGEEVSDVALGYLLCLSRKLHIIDSSVKSGNWIKPAGNSLTGKKVCLVGFGDIGRCTARKLLAFNLDVYVSDPGFTKVDGKIVCSYNPEVVVDENLQKVHLGSLEESMTNTDYVIVTCNLNKFTHHLINKNNIVLANKGVRIINVARGPVVKEDDVLELLENGHIDSVGFDVFEKEPLSLDNKLQKYSNSIFGSHNGSNTLEAVNKVSYFAINKISEYLYKL
jgi:D-3-phosphoglycerate dehydrogenase